MSKSRKKKPKHLLKKPSDYSYPPEVIGKTVRLRLKLYMYFKEQATWGETISDVIERVLAGSGVSIKQSLRCVTEVLFLYLSKHKLDETGEQMEHKFHCKHCQDTGIFDKYWFCDCILDNPEVPHQTVREYRNDMHDYKSVRFEFLRLQGAV